MREIKFRAWLPKVKKMEYGIEKDGDLGDILADSNNGGEFYKVMQYTGLKDKDGNEIYEGDIIEYKKINEFDSDYRGYVLFDKSSWRVNWEDDLCIIRKDLEFWAVERNIEVIGNIYENPGLLEGEEW